MDRLYEPPRSWTWPHYRFIQWVVPRICRLYGGHCVRGLQNVPAEGGALIAANHVSHLDPPVVGTAFRRRSYYFAAAELFRNPIFGRFIRRCYAFPVRRGEADRTALKAAIELLEMGELLTMFPEGTRSHTGEIGEFDLGAALAASRARVPIIPCAVSGTDRVLPRGARWLRHGQVIVTFGESIDTLKYGEKPRKDDLRRITEEVEASVRAMRVEQQAWLAGQGRC